MVLDTLKDCVRKQDIGGIKSVFFIILSRRPSPEKINANLNYCFANGIDKNKLFVAHDGEIFSDNVKDWNIDYYSKQVGKIRNNFSRERMAQVIKMADYLFAEDNQKRAEAKANQRAKTNKNDNTIVYIVAGAIAALIAFLFI